MPGTAKDTPSAPGTPAGHRLIDGIRDDWLYGNRRPYGRWRAAPSTSPSATEAAVAAQDAAQEPAAAADAHVPAPDAAQEPAEAVEAAVAAPDAAQEPAAAADAHVPAPDAAQEPAEAVEAADAAPDAAQEPAAAADAHVPAPDAAQEPAEAVEAAVAAPDAAQEPAAAADADVPVPQHGQQGHHGHKARSRHSRPAKASANGAPDAAQEPAGVWSRFRSFAGLRPSPQQLREVELRQQLACERKGLEDASRCYQDDTFRSHSGELNKLHQKQTLEAQEISFCDVTSAEARDWDRLLCLFTVDAEEICRRSISSDARSGSAGIDSDEVAAREDALRALLGDSEHRAFQAVCVDARTAIAIVHRNTLIADESNARAEIDASQVHHSFPLAAEGVSLAEEARRRHIVASSAAAFDTATEVAAMFVEHEKCRRRLIEDAFATSRTEWQFFGTRAAVLLEPADAKHHSPVPTSASECERCSLMLDATQVRSTGRRCTRCDRAVCLGCRAIGMSRVGALLPVCAECSVEVAIHAAAVSDDPAAQGPTALFSDGAFLPDVVGAAAAFAETPEVTLRGAAWARKAVCVAVVGPAHAGKTFVANALAGVCRTTVADGLDADGAARFRTVPARIAPAANLPTFAAAILGNVNVMGTECVFLDTHASATDVDQSGPESQLSDIAYGFADTVVVVAPSPAEAAHFDRALRDRDVHGVTFLHVLQAGTPVPTSLTDAPAIAVQRAFNGLVPMRDPVFAFGGRSDNSMHVFLAQDLDGSSSNEEVFALCRARISVTSRGKASPGDALCGGFNAMLARFGGRVVGSWAFDTSDPGRIRLRHSARAERGGTSPTPQFQPALAARVKRVELSLHAEPVWAVPPFDEGIDDGLIDAEDLAYVLSFDMAGCQDPAAAALVHGQLTWAEEGNEQGGLTMACTDHGECVRIDVTGPMDDDGRLQRVDMTTPLEDHHIGEANGPIAVRMGAADPATGAVKFQVQFWPAVISPDLTLR